MMKGKVLLKDIKRIITGCLLTLVLCIGLPCLTMEAQATNKTQKEALDWVKSKVGIGIDVDGGPKSQPQQCVDLIMAYYTFLGEKSPGGNGCDYATNALPSGWKRIQGATPQPGDILVYTGTQYGHVAIFESEYSTYHQNFNGHAYVEKVTYHYNVFSSPRYWGVIRPNFTVRNWYDTLAAASLNTTFYAQMTNKEAWLDVGKVSDNAQLVNNASAASVWKFVKQSDGTYIIYNCDGNKVLTVSGTNVIVSPQQGTDNGTQRWYIYQSGNGGYVLRPKSGDKVLDIKSGSYTAGTNVQIADYSGSYAQSYTLNIVEPVKSTNVSLYMLGDATHKTMFAWDQVQGTEGYHVRIKKGTAGNVTTYLNLDNFQDTSYELQLEPGYYEVYVETYNYFTNFKSNTIKFTVREKAKVEESFRDISSWKWYVDAVQYVFENDLMNGSAGLFKPTANITRAQLVTTLYRLAGEPPVASYSAFYDFYDVALGTYYTDAVCWAYDEGIATGSDGKFNPTGNLTRQQLATFLFRYAEYEGMDTTVRGDISSMMNAEKVGEYAKEAVEWAVGVGLISGSESEDADGNKVYDLNPKGNTTRAQVAAILQRFCEN